VSLLEFIVLALATWRISSLFVDEPGPFRIFIRIRELTGITHDMDDNVVIIPDGFLPSILSCIWCFGFWAGLFWTLMFIFVPCWFYFALPLALNAVAIKLQR